ncbi:MAG: peptidase [Kiloniellales bacterium]|nr:peptidase [Kiloniellales bacterium]
MKTSMGSLAAAGLALALALAAGPAAAGPERGALLDTYADIAQAGYEDSLATARTLGEAVDTLLGSPSEAHLAAAREAWLAARVPYQQTEVFRFGNAIVDDWEGKVNAWPLDEGLIDYVDASYGGESDENLYYTANVIANEKLDFGGKTIDAAKITKALLAETLHELDEVEANVATGYHAIEFLLWGQDLNANGPGAGERPASDFDPANCSGGNCERRAAYLKTVTDLLLDDLAEMAGHWAPDGEARKQLMAEGADGGLRAMLTGLGSLSYGELAGERIKLGLLLHDPEEEHDCFSDNTHNSHYYNAVGMRNVYLGRYERVDGKVVSGPGLSDLVAKTSSELDKEMKAALEATHAAMTAMKTRAETVEAYDQMIGPDNAEGNAVIEAVIASLTGQTKSIERIVAALELGSIAFEGSDSLDNPDAVFQ